MLTVRNVFTAKPGMASKLAKQLHDAWHERGFRILTDTISQMNTVVLEFDVKNLSEYEAQYKEYSTDPRVKKAMEGYTDLYLSGRREVLQRYPS